MIKMDLPKDGSYLAYPAAFMIPVWRFMPRDGGFKYYGPISGEDFIELEIDGGRGTQDFVQCFRERTPRASMVEMNRRHHLTPNMDVRILTHANVLPYDRDDYSGLIVSFIFALETERRATAKKFWKEYCDFAELEPKIGMLTMGDGDPRFPSLNSTSGKVLPFNPRSPD